MIRLGMVGGGQGAFIGAVHRIAARIDGRFQLVAGALSANPERALASAKQLHISPERSYSDFKQMAIEEAKREDGIQAVTIVTPNHMHYPAAKAFLEQGIHVICDKPMTSSLADALELAQIAKRSEVMFVLTHNYSAYPMVRQARAMVENGDLGNIRVIQAEYAQDWLTEASELGDNKQAQWRTDPKRSGPAGCLGDIGTHAYHLARFISGLKLEKVSADLTSFVEGRQLDDNVHSMLRFEKGAKGMLWSSQVAPGNENGLKVRIYGDKGGLSWEQESPNRLVFDKFGSAQQILTRGGHGYTGSEHLVRIPAGHPEGYLEGFANLYNEIADGIEACATGKLASDVLNDSLLPTVSDGVDGLEFIQAILDSSEADGRWTSLGGA
ncbi:gfo/Idh/MocA family oxidoreductase [Alginatibacterium sediminis]|uniref:Gfo/Idh/MocA family oxidoreductase n=1 Tax=Alginatibacterium sediminis TaxID=2164068 RepID=A0A420ECV4_9ALTE|nr:Gfo/Idh/MocA family oxidoreductase [Alginatibacterium sediminis]RKF18484.1 gfo/Idh/MocA family oxidoreductase [Alginatibacterium sediminis]